jgi:hypothetical protein
MNVCLLAKNFRGLTPAAVQIRSRLSRSSSVNGSGFVLRAFGLFMSANGSLVTSLSTLRVA